MYYLNIFLHLLAARAFGHVRILLSVDHVLLETIGLPDGTSDAMVYNP